MSLPSVNVVLDSRLAARGLGIGRFIDSLLAGFAEGGFSPSVFGATQKRSDSSNELLRSMGLRSALFSATPSLCGLGRDAVIHYASNSASLLTPSRSVTTVYDLFQRDASSLVGKAQWHLLRRGLARSRILSPISSIGVGALIEFGVDRRRLRLITPGMRPPEDRGYGRSGVLAFGGSSKRKRPELLVSVLEALSRAGWDEPLTVVARAGLTAEHCQRLLRIGADVRSNCTDLELQDLYFRRALLLVTSSHEGFGLPLVEAGEHQLPAVLGADAVVAPEAIGPHCFLAQSTDPSAWVTAIREATRVTNPLSGRYLPSWKDVADAYLDVYGELA